ncbi:hypothetical protein KOR42_20540 [Thalassoglobus neptunius]|uniref:Uncharacterized protein n=1 Tax=Thalassoglobus neptunius TaxID=1938619 RepID=A0A5C5X9Y4_9PLAN|nr:hypothetical protein [Thalassoglobus neptunius]TWT58672.1 hypothetical protein KOR42_20540 [Thalassoglobus neptunius]
MLYSLARRVVVAAFLSCALMFASSAWACPFCSAPSLTLTEQLNASQAAVLVQWSGGEEPNREKSFAGTTNYEVLEIVHDDSGSLEKEQVLQLDRYRAAQKGDLFVLLGTLSDGRIEWSSPLEVTEASYNYMRQAPTKEAATTERLAYFMKFLEYPDKLIADDAYGEFANAPYEDIVPLRSVMPREDLRKWLSDPQTTPTRYGLYGLMLGLCGQEEDAEFLKNMILEETDDFRLGIDGVMGGYLVLTGDKGLDVLDESKLANRDVPFSETFAAMQALRFMWTCGDGEIAPERLRQSMRILLDRPNLADLVIVDLARWKDVSVMDRLITIYNSEEYNVPSIKRSIVRYFLITEKDSTTTADGGVPEHVAKAKEYLAKLREEDPKTVKAAERYFFD